MDNSDPQVTAEVLKEDVAYKVAAVVAMNRVGTIGHEDGIPWRMKKDMQHFRKTTRHGVVIMGRKTYDTLGRPLKNRHNIVLSRNPVDTNEDNLEYVDSVESAMKIARSKCVPIYIIGGSEIYELFTPHIDEWIVTLVDDMSEGDTRFPGYPEDGTDVIGKVFSDMGYELKEDLLEIHADEDNEHDAGVYKLTKRPQTAANFNKAVTMNKKEVRRLTKNTREKITGRIERRKAAEKKKKDTNRKRNKAAKQSRKRNRR